jgi:hypothetical protein
MLMPPALRKLVLTSHVVTSVGWLGAVAAFLVLSIAGLTSNDAAVVRGAYVSMDLIGQYVIVPLSLTTLFIGVVQSLGTQWGLVRYYWVLAKLTLTLGATFLLLLHQFTVVAEAARLVSATEPSTLPELDGLGRQLVFDAGLAMFVLVVTTTLSIYKPWGRTSFGRHAMAQESGITRANVETPTGVKVFVAIIGAILIAILVSHLAGGGLRHHRM